MFCDQTCCTQLTAWVSDRNSLVKSKGVTSKATRGARLEAAAFRRGACSDACQVYSFLSGGSECAPALVVVLPILRVVLALLVLLALGA